MSPRGVSYLLFAAIVAGAALLHLGPVILAALFSYMALHFISQPIQGRVHRYYVRLVSLAAFLVITAGVSWMFAFFIRQTLSTVPTIAVTALPKLAEFVETFGISLPFENVQELRQIIVDSVKENAVAITRTSGLVTKGFFQIVIGFFVAILIFLSDHDRDYKPNLFDALRKEFADRVRAFAASFELVLGAQVMISVINTVITAIYLIAMDIPYIAFLVPATFILGILPLVGNLLSNTLIVGTALTLSPKAAIASLAFLIIVHKLEYFLNSKIVGDSIRAPMWQTLLGILVGEVVLGVPGIVLAPALLHYMKEEMRGVPYAKLTSAPSR